MNINDIPAPFHPTEKTLPNRSEEEFRQYAKSKGIKVMKKGWFDLICVDPDGKIFIAEVKSRSDRLKKEQVFILALLEKAGIECYIARPYKTKDKLERFHMDMWDVKRSELYTGMTKEPEPKPDKPKPKLQYDQASIKKAKRIRECSKKAKLARMADPSYNWYPRSEW